MLSIIAQALSTGEEFEYTHSRYRFITSNYSSIVASFKYLYVACRTTVWPTIGNQLDQLFRHGFGCRLREFQLFGRYQITFCVQRLLSSYPSSAVWCTGDVLAMLMVELLLLLNKDIVSTAIVFVGAVIGSILVSFGNLVMALLRTTGSSRCNGIAAQITITIHMPQQTSKILLVGLTATKNGFYFRYALRVPPVSLCDLGYTRSDQNTVDDYLTLSTITYIDWFLVSTLHTRTEVECFCYTSHFEWISLSKWKTIKVRELVITFTVFCSEAFIIFFLTWYTFCLAFTLAESVS